jgi:hypothetical protein
VVVANREQVGRQLASNPEVLEQAHDLVVEVHGARETVDLAEPLEHGYTMPRLAKECRERLADRAVTDDRDVHVLVLVLGGGTGG